MPVSKRRFPPARTMRAKTKAGKFQRWDTTEIHEREMRDKARKHKAKQKKAHDRAVKRQASENHG